MNKTVLLQQAWQTGHSFPDYHAWVETLVQQGKTSGTDQSEKMVQYTKLNAARSKRWLKTARVGNNIINLLKEQEIKVLAVTEAWCGDTAQNLPYFHLLCEQANIDYKLCLRDEHPELMEHFLTNGGKAIPIVIFMSATFEVLAHWGPRPAPLQQMVMDYKNLPEPKPDYDTFSIGLQQWYNQDHMSTLENEVTDLLQLIIKK